MVATVYADMHTGFNVETVAYKGVNFTTWDVSGRSKLVS